ncbi:NosD domain-containing protein [Methanofollis aquaemaris]|nr:NosD domain-containing protein [Methanofollis aquaemaris]
MNKMPPFRKNAALFIVLLAVLFCLVLPVAGGEDGAGPSETTAPLEPPSNITNATVPALNLSLAADPPAGTVPLTVRFTAAVQGLAVDLWNWTVDGVAAVGNESTFNHTFFEPGTHVVGLTAVNESASVANTSSVDINVAAAPAPAAVVLADGDGSGHPRDWYVSKTGTGNVSSLLDITDLDAGDTIHIRGVEGHTYEGGFVIDKPNVTVKRWEGSPVQPLITSTSGASAFTVTADNATFLDLNISDNQLNGKGGAGINATGTPRRYLQRLTITNCTFAGNTVTGKGASGGALSAQDVDNILIEGTAFTGNSADYGGGAYFSVCTGATLTGTTFTGNTATYGGGGALFHGCYAATLTGTTFTANTANEGGGAYFNVCHHATLTNTTFTGNTADEGGGGAYFGECKRATLTGNTFTGNTATYEGGGAFFYYYSMNVNITNCRFDNPTNIHATMMSSAAALNTTRTPGTNIAGGPFLGGNLWLQDPAQNISEWAADADFDGICDQPLSLGAFGTDHLPLIYGGTVQINATPAADGAFVYVDGTNTTRTADNPFYLPVGNHTVTVHKEGFFTGEKRITVAPDENDPLDLTLTKIIHPMDWYVSKFGGDLNVTTISAIPEIGTGDTIHIWGVEGHAYDSGVVINASNVMVKRWEGSPARPLITNISQTAPAFTVTADNATFRDLNISRNRVDGNGAAINATGDSGNHLERLTITNCTFADNAANGTSACGGALHARYVDHLLVEGTGFTNNTAVWGGGGARFEECNDATLAATTFTGNNATVYGGGAFFYRSPGPAVAGTTFTGNTAGTDSGGLCFWISPDPSVANATFTDNRARQYGGGAFFYESPNATVTATAFTGNTATDGGGASFRNSQNATVTDCRLDNPTNIHADSSPGAVLNGTYQRGTNIAGGPYLGGNLWLTDPEQNISECGADADYDGICDENLTLTNFGTDHLPLIYDLDRGTVQINATPADAFVSVDGTNTSRTAGNAFYLPVGEHMISVHKAGYLPGEETITVTAGENKTLDLNLREIIHPMDWYVSTISGNYTNISKIPDLGAGDTIHIWGVAGHTYDGGFVIDKPNVTVKRWEGSPVQPLITSADNTTSAFTVTADNATFLDLNISDNHLNYYQSRGAGINATGSSGKGNHLKRLTITNCTFAGNKMTGRETWGGALSAEYVDALLVEGTAFTGNSAVWGGGGAWFSGCDAATLTGTTFTGNTARDSGGGAWFQGCDDATLTGTTFSGNNARYGGGAYFMECHAATLTGTTFSGNNARYGGGAYFYYSDDATLTNCRFDNPTNIYAMDSFCATLNTTRTSGTNIAGGPYLGGNLWLQDPAQNISEWAADADFDGICDQPLKINCRGGGVFGTDHLPLMHGGGTVVINATPADAFVFINGTNTTRTADNPFYLPVGNHTISVHKAGYFPGEQTITVVPGENDPLDLTLTKIDHPMNWYVSTISGNYTTISAIPEIGTGDTVHVWGVEGHAYDSGVVIDKPDVTVKRWEGSPVQPLITSTSGASAFTVTADNATFLDLDISRNTLNDTNGAAINAVGTSGNPLQRLTITNCTFADNAVNGTNTDGGALSAEYVDALLVEGTAFTGNTASSDGGGAIFEFCTAATLTGTTFTANTAGDYGGGADFEFCTGATLTGTTFTDNTAASGGGAGFGGCTGATITNCRLDNPTNIHARGSTAVLNSTYASGTNIAGGPYLGGNLWLNDPAQNISECGKDADFDGICDGTLSTDLGTDELPLIYDLDRGTVVINATPADAFVSVDGANTTRTAGGAFYLPVGEHTVSVHKEGFFTCEQNINVTAGENDPLTFDLMESTHPIDWYVSTISGNFSSLQEIPEIGEGDTVHIWGVAGHAYEGGIVINASDVTIRQWEGSPVKPLITSTNHTAPAFTVTANNATFRGLDISGNCLDDDEGLGAGINATGSETDHLKRLTIADCTFAGNTVNGTGAGGGALSAGYVDDLLVERTAFTGNNATRYGGGARFLSCNDTVLADTAFTDNAARFGGGVQFLFCNDSVLTDTTVTGNRASSCGGGADFLYSHGPVTLAGTAFTDNTAANQGGGARFYIAEGSCATLTGTAFTDNSAGFGGGAYFAGSYRAALPAAVLAGATFVNNTAEKFGGGAYLVDCDAAMLTDLSFDGNSADDGGGAYFYQCDDATLNASAFTGNRAAHAGGAINVTGHCGSSKVPLQHFAIADCTFTGNAADGCGGALSARAVDNLSVERTVFAGNDAPVGGGTHLSWCNDTFVADCRFENPANIFAENSTGALNATRTRGTNIAGGPFLGGNLWLTDPAQNISEWGPDIDCDGICDQPSTIPGLGTDALPLATGGDRGTVLVRASAHGGFVHIDGTNTTRTADHFPAPAPRAMARAAAAPTPPSDAFFLPTGNHTVEIVGATTYGRATVNIPAGATERVIVEVGEVEIQGYAIPRQGLAPLNVTFDTGFTDPAPDRLTWTFGDDNESSPCYWPSHTYEKAGRYTATLTAAWGEGSDLVTLVRTVNLTVGMPAPSLHLSAVEGNAPFTLGINVSGDGMPERWHLDLGDGRTVEGASPAEINRSVTYENAGTYPLVLTVSTGAFTTITTGTVTVHAPPTTPSSESNSGHSPISAGSTGSIPAGESASMKMKGTGIYEVRVTAGEDIPKVMITIKKTGRPSGVDAPAGTVYEYDEVTLYHTTEDAIEEIVVSFGVPKTWLEEHGLEPADVALYRYDDDGWQPLPTSVDGEDETSRHFSARSPGFFLFAIGGEPSAVSTPVMTPAAAAETVETFVTSPPAGPTPADTPTPFPTMLLVVGGAILLLLVAVAVWRTR